MQQFTEQREVMGKAARHSFVESSGTSALNERSLLPSLFLFYFYFYFLCHQHQYRARHYADNLFLRILMRILMTFISEQIKLKGI